MRVIVLSLCKKVKLILLPFFRSPDATLETQYNAICPYCGKKGREHKEINCGSTTVRWNVLNRIYLLSCYSNTEEPWDWHVVRVGNFKFSARSYPRGFGKSVGYKWEISLN